MKNEITRAGRRIKPTSNQFDLVEYETGKQTTRNTEIKTMTLYPIPS